ncbi:T9SS type A sorting domain-containing protein [Flavobacterium psychrotolerans]|uniref:Secretion system C-terminal sorting domain-containing protein n=1 Tax=Flavobacterium psychrotolerans TaxID=2169410 RepID=A0A2U1JJ47_9FLAO|nr:T9SS type A sorting domain-containing protein [Flavobacterium psychrotolerans]PWA05161.1 hypothetical protein DB895_07580 [Flavobacterium psychrotolerans]
MKKNYILLLLIVAFTANAQTELIINGGFEHWSAGQPDGFTITVPSGGGKVEQGTIEKHSGTSAAVVTAPIGSGTGTLRTTLEDFTITEGHSYTLSYWYKDESNNAKCRHWGVWRTASTAIPDNTLQPSLYNENTAGTWKQITITTTAPATATILKLDFRTIQESSSAGGGILYLDDISLIDNTLAVKKNSILGLNVYPNPVTKGNLFIDSDSNETKSIVIFDLLGKQVLKTAVVSNQAINISDLISGIYILKITEEGKTATRKLVIR